VETTVKLTDKQDKFARVYVETGNASEAYRQAYPRSKAWKPETLHPHASNMLKNNKVMARVDGLRVEKQAKYEAEARKQGLAPEQIIAEQARTAFFDPALLFDAEGRLLPLHLMPEDARRAVKKFKVRGVKTDDDTVQGVVAEVEMHDKLKALRDIGEHLGMYRQIHEHHRWADDLRAMSDDELAREAELAQEELDRALRERDEARRH